MVLHVGDQVLYGKYSGTELEHDGKNTLSCVKAMFSLFWDN